MKKNNGSKWIILLSVFFMILTSACKDNIKPNRDVLDSFKSNFPKAKDIKWKSEKGYSIAVFNMSDNSKNTEQYGNRKYNHRAWFLQNGSLEQTEKAMIFSNLPQLVQDAFKAGKYTSSDWVIEEVKQFRKRYMNDKLTYKIEVENKRENNEVEVDLYYSEDGTLLKEKIDSDGKDEDDFDEDDFPSASMTDEVLTFLKKKYPNYRLYSYEREYEYYEANILYNNSKISVYFSANYAWLASAWEVSLGIFPNVVMNKLMTDYSSYEKGDTYEIEGLDSKTYYGIELEKDQMGTDKEIFVVFDINGIVVKQLDI